MESLNFKVTGINCPACTKIIKMDLEEIEGVKDVDVSLEGDVEVSSEIPISLDQVKNILAGSEFKIVGE